MIALLLLGVCAIVTVGAIPCPDTGISLRFGGVCYPNGSYFRPSSSIDRNNVALCVHSQASDGTNDGGWILPNGDPCTSGSTPFECNNGTGPGSTNIAIRRVMSVSGFVGTFKCCLPNDCDTEPTDVITAIIFDAIVIVENTVDLPSDITAIPQSYTVHCVAAIVNLAQLEEFSYYYPDNNGDELTSDYCSSQDGYSCSLATDILSMDITTENLQNRTINVTWEAEVISSGAFRQDSNNGDHTIECYVRRVSGGGVVVIRESNVTITAPSLSPTDIQVNTTTTSITVSWTYDDTSDADGFVVYYNGTAEQVVGGGMKETTLVGLIPGTSYSITVRAYQDILGPPSTTHNIATNDVSTSVSIQRVAPLTEVTNNTYTVTCTIDIQPDTTDINGTDVTATLMNNVYVSSRTFSAVLGDDLTATCNWSINGGMFTNTTTAQAAGTPTSVTASIINSTSISVSWTAPEGGANGYIVAYNDGSNADVSGTETVLSGLTMGTQYTITVYGYNDVLSVASVAVSITLDVPTPVDNVMANTVTSTSITVTWVPTNANMLRDITGYTISYVADCSGQTISDSITVSNSTTTVTLPGLEEGLNHNITVTAVNVLGQSDPVMIVQDTDAILPVATVSGVLVSAIDATTYKIAWDGVDNCLLYNGDFVGYTVSIRNDTTSSTINTTNTETQVNLVAGVEYNIAVAVVNEVGVGPFSDDVVYEAGTLPGIVMSVSVETQATAATVSWGEPDFVPANFPVTIFEVGYFTSDDTSCNTSITASSLTLEGAENITQRTATLDGLMSSTCYAFVVRAYTENGPGLWTGVLRRTQEEPPPMTTSTSTSIPTTPTPTDTGTDANTGSGGAAIGAGVGVAIVVFLIVVAIIVVIVVFICLRKKKSEGEGKKYTHTYTQDSNDQLVSQDYSTISDSHQYSAMDEKGIPTSAEYASVETPFSAEEPMYADMGGGDALYSDPSEKKRTFDPCIPRIIPVPLPDLGTHVANCHMDNNNGFQEQYKAIYTGDDKPCSVGFSEENKLLNRFKNITTYDDNRVVLLPNGDHPDCQRSFVNASYVDGYTCGRKFLAAQGPLKKTTIDFWRLIWQERPQIIVMVTNLKEGNKTKCELYWPPETSTISTFGPFNITLAEEQVFPDFVIRTLSVQLQDDPSNDCHTLTQYHLTSWPDHGVPDYATPLMILHKKTISTYRMDQGPIMVHCSAGVGRTGTFIALDLALDQAAKEKVVDLAGIVTRLREQRMKMVQTVDQFVFLHDAVLEAVSCGSTDVKAEDLKSHYNKLTKVNPATGVTNMATQFHLLSQVTPDPDDVSRNSALAYPNKNRSDQYLPMEKHLVPMKENKSYINASYVPGYRDKKAMIIAQSPMENTTRDFWRMVDIHNVSAIVMLCEAVEEGLEVCYQYWPTSDIGHYNEYSIECKMVEKKRGFVERSFQLTNQDTQVTKKVTQFQIQDWAPSGQVTRPQTIIQVIEEVIRVQQRTGGGPVVVHCSDTVSRSGVYCAASNALEQCKAEGELDVFQSTKAIRMHKPGAVTTLEQYDSIFKIIDIYLDMNSTYANFQLS